MHVASVGQVDAQCVDERRYGELPHGGQRGRRPVVGLRAYDPLQGGDTVDTVSVAVKE